MKCRCIGQDGVAYYFKHEGGEAPKLGVAYTLEDATHGTAAQNRAFHSLLNAFYLWMEKTDGFIFEDGGRIYDLSTPSQEDFREFFKYKYGEGFSHVQYVDNNFAMVKVDSIDDVPGDIIQDFNNGNRGRIKGVLKSWSDYTLKQRKACIDSLFDVVRASGCNDRKVEEIMEGMQHEPND